MFLDLRRWADESFGYSYTKFSLKDHEEQHGSWSEKKKKNSGHLPCFIENMIVWIHKSYGMHNKLLKLIKTSSGKTQDHCIKSILFLQYSNKQSKNKS